MNYSIPGFLVLHCLPEFAQTHIRWVGDAIQPPHPLSPPSLPALNLSQQSLFQLSWLFASDGRSIGASASVLPMNIQGWSPLGLTVWSPCSPRDSHESSPTPQFKSINSLVLSLLFGPPLISIHDYWKSHSFDNTDHDLSVWMLSFKLARVFHLLFYLHQETLVPLCFLPLEWYHPSHTHTLSSHSQR